MHFDLPKYFSSAFLDDELDFGDGSVAVGVRHRPSYRETQNNLKIIIKGTAARKGPRNLNLPNIANGVHNRSVVIE